MRNIATTFSYINVSRWNIQQMEMFQTMQTRSEIGLPNIRGELSYLAPLGSENISAPYFKQCFFGGGVLPPPDWVKHHASQSQERNNKYFILYIEFCTNNKI